MLRRTWAYGTRRAAQVLRAERVGRTSIVTVAALVDGTLPQRDGEAFIMVGGGHAVPLDKLKTGDRATIEFAQGGPTGGFWRVVEHFPKV